MTSEFRLTDTGPLDWLWAQTGPRHLMLRAVFIACFTWIPLLVLNVVAKQGDGAAPAIPFLHDLSAHVRFLLMAPLLVLVEGSIGARSRLVAESFIKSNLVREADMARFLEAARKTKAWAGSSLVEAALVAISVLMVSTALQTLLHDGVVFWFEVAGPGAERLSPAGWWYAIASPFPAFLFLRWGWRYLLWCWFLRRVSRLDLRLVGTHPDRAAGLGFVAIGHSSFAVLGFAASCVVASAAATEVLYAGVPLMTYKAPVIAFVVAALIVGLAPAVVFLKPLAKVKRAGLLRYGDLSTRYAQDFEGKWLGDGALPSEPLLGTGDIQSLADLGGGFERLETMRLSPFGKQTVIAFGVAAVLPLLPLALTVMPLKEILKKLAQALI